MHTTANSARRLGFSTVSLVAASLLFSTAARADEPKPDPGSATAGPEAKDKDKGDAQGAGDLRENPLTRYYFLGVRFRDIVVPQFMLEIFASGGATGNVWLVGPELSMRKNNTEVDISLAYADYGFGPAMFKAKDDPEIGYEVVRSDLKVAYLTVDLLLDVPLDKSGMFDFLIGGGVGVGVVAGDLYRDQTYPKNGGAPDPSDPSKWEKCRFVNDGEPGYCDNSNAHFFKNGKDYSEKSWIDGGSKPVVIPWISLPQLSLRVKPIKQLQARLDAGFSVSGFFFGLAAGYGF